jgi:hypothetical protein
MPNARPARHWSALVKPHSAGATVTGSGNNITASDPSAGAAVTPRMIARLEISYTDGRDDVIVSDRRWRTSLGPLVTDAWAADQTSGRITGTWGYYVMITKLAMMANLTGHDTDAAHYSALADDIKTAFNAHFYDTSLRRYTTDGNAGTTGATQTAQALALDAGLVPDTERGAVLDTLVELVNAFHANGDGPHFSGRHHRYGPHRSRARRRRPGRRPLGPAPGRRPTQRRLLHAAHDRQPRRQDHHRRSVGPRKLQKPHDPRPDRRVVPHRPDRNPGSRRLGRLPALGHPAQGRRRPHPCAGQLPDAVWSGPLRMEPNRPTVPAHRHRAEQHHRRDPGTDPRRPARRDP